MLSLHINMLGGGLCSRQRTRRPQRRGDYRPNHRRLRPMPKTKSCKVERKDGWFHEPKVEELKHRLNTAKRIFLKNMTAKKLELFKSTRVLIDKELQNIRNVQWLQWCETINAHSSTSSLWTHLNRARGSKLTTLPCHPDVPCQGGVGPDEWFQTAAKDY